MFRGDKRLAVRALWHALLALAQWINEAQSACPSPYYPSAHTACLDPSPYSTYPKGVGQTDIDTILSEHNKYRASVQATDMQTMYWDKELAFVAQKWAENCAFAYDTQREIICKYSAGQNLALGYPNWVSAIQSWYNETFKFSYGNSSYNLGDIGRYTQIMWNNTAKVGCGYSYCTSYNSGLYVCNYSPSGNVLPRVTTPYTNGTKCSACPNRCNSRGLCDCGGLVCKNGGVLNLNTCTCSCLSLYRGSADCNLNCTGAADLSYCNKSAPAGYPPSYCSMYSNVPSDCPLMCGTCPGTMCTTLQSASIDETSTTAASTIRTAPATTIAAQLTTKGNTTVPTTAVAMMSSPIPTVVNTTSSATLLTTSLKNAPIFAATTVAATTSRVTATTALINQTKSNCPSPYYPTTHTACLNTSRYSTAPKGISAQEKEAIVAEHNKYRSSVQATDMQKMYWDDELAFIAQKLAENCTFAHDTEHDVLCKYSLGQNLALGYPNWVSAIQGWYNETYKFSYGNSSYNVADIGHYTQMMWNDTAKVGCGYSYCTNYGSAFFVCNYAPAGNVATRITLPFTNGTKCAACLNRCTSSGLCDCGGLVCKNGGELNVSTCSCSCPPPYQGSADCNLNCTGVVDWSYCNKSAPYGYPSSYCQLYNIVPFKCPLMCGTCPGTACMALQSISIAETLISSEFTTPAAPTAAGTNATITTQPTMSVSTSKVNITTPPVTAAGTNATITTLPTMSVSTSKVNITAPPATAAATNATITTQPTMSVSTSKVNITTPPATAAGTTATITTLPTMSVSTSKVNITAPPATAAGTNATITTRPTMSVSTTKVNITAPPATAAATTTKLTSLLTTTSKSATTVSTTRVATTTTKVTSTTAKKGSTCPSSLYPENHAACLKPSAYSRAPKGVTAENISTIITEHNKYRASVQATDMQKMYWDEELAYVAQKLAESCDTTSYSPTNILCKYSSGQNGAAGVSSWASAIQAWYDGANYFTYGSSENDFAYIGSYTLMVWNETAKVGCGYSYCSNLGGRYMCVYSPNGNLASRISFPYTYGRKCSACPNHCSPSGLCDCGGLVCKNGGVLNVSDCTCSCPSTYRGSPDCNLNCTGIVDESFCNEPGPCGVLPSDCPSVSSDCPWMCGTCPGCLALQTSSIAALATATSSATTKATTSTATTPKFTTQAFTAAKNTSLPTLPLTAVNSDTNSGPTTTTSKQTTLK